MKKEDKLAIYKRKRDFTITAEPQGAADTARLKRKLTKSKNPLFVIQKHAASHLHYDLRLEIDGVLASWAVPKGPSTDPRVRRLAIATEDHPMDYAFFQGEIAQGYGAGIVMVWDIGTYRSLKGESMAQSLANGRIEVDLQGHKLQGAYALIKTKQDNNWLFFKQKDAYADARRNPVSTQDYSALDGVTFAALRKRYTKGGKKR